MRLRRLLAAIGLVASTAASSRASDVAIIVHPSSTYAELSLGDLTRLFRADQARWKSGDRVDLVLQVGNSARQDVILSRVFHMTADDLRAFWLGKVFRGEMAMPPRAFASDVSVMRYVAANPRAIGYIESALLDESVKGLRIDGKRPGEPGYPLTREAPAAVSTPTPRARP